MIDADRRLTEEKIAAIKFGAEAAIKRGRDAGTYRCDDILRLVEALEAAETEVKSLRILIASNCTEPDQSR